MQELAYKQRIVRDSVSTYINRLRAVIIICPPVDSSRQAAATRNKDGNITRSQRAVAHTRGSQRVDGDVTLHVDSSSQFRSHRASVRGSVDKIPTLTQQSEGSNPVTAAPAEKKSRCADGSSAAAEDFGDGPVERAKPRRTNSRI